MPIVATVGYVTSGQYAAFSAFFLAGLNTVQNSDGQMWNGDPAAGANQNVKILPGEARGSYDAKGEKQHLNRQVVRMSNDPTVNMVVAVGGLVSAFAAAKHSTKPFLVMIGQLPAIDDFDLDPDKDFNFCGGINLNTTVTNTIRHQAAVSLASCAPGEVFLLFNKNARMARAEKRAWEAHGWRSIAAGVDDDGENDSDFLPIIRRARRKGAKALIVSADPFFALKRNELVGAIHDASISPPMFAIYPSPYFAGATPAPTAGRFRWVGPDLTQQYHNIGVKTGTLLNKIRAAGPEFIGLDTALQGVGPTAFPFTNLLE